MSTQQKTSDPDEQTMTNNSDSPERESVFSALTGVAFNQWRAIAEQARNRSEGYDETRNDPSYCQPPGTHSPSSLLGCHRMVQYRSSNTPREDTLPHGLFQFGHHFEDMVEDFIRESVLSGRQTVVNPVQVEFEVAEQRTIKGSTDPVIMSSDGTPLILTEVKSTKSLYHVNKSGPYEQHRAQAHAYCEGIRQQYDLDEHVPIVYIYGSRQSLDVTVFTEQFDNEFWTETVIPWVQENTTHRLGESLAPTVDPHQEYMCGYCDYSHRCGNVEPGPEPIRLRQLIDAGTFEDDTRFDPEDFADSGLVLGDKSFWWDSSFDQSIINSLEDQPLAGFLPCHEYPESTVVAHLMTHDNLKLTPTLAAQHPELVDDGTEPSERFQALYGGSPQRDVYDWVCPDCGEQFAFEDTDWDGNLDDRPVCGSCSHLPTLRGPLPDEQISASGVDHEHIPDIF